MNAATDHRIPPATSSGTVATRHGDTWYRVTGDLTESGDRAPLVVLHGGPGVAHDYTLAMANLAVDGRAVVHYDQMGCGLSTHLPQAPSDLWTVELFVEELRTLVTHLGIADRFHLLGQSWGGMLAPEVALDDSSGIASLIICDSPASMALWMTEAAGLRAQLPDDVRHALDEHERTGDLDDPAYVAATQVFYDRHVCRTVPNPPEVTASFAQVEADPTVYHAMNGPNEFHVIGSLREWSVVDRLHAIDVPTLVVAGAHDEATPATWAPFVDQIPNARSHVFADSSHMPHVEEPEAFIDVVGSFLAAHDRPVTHP